MATQGIRAGDMAARTSHKEAVTAVGPMAGDAGGEAATRQQEIFESRREELLAAHPGRHIAVCSGEVFVGDSATEVLHAAMRSHPGRASLFYSPGRERRILTDRDVEMLAERGLCVRQAPTAPTPEEDAMARRHDAEVSRGEREAARQRKVFESRREELLAAHPGRHIAVCSGEVFVGDSVREVMRMATRAHPDSASFFHSPQPTIVNL